MMRLRRTGCILLLLFAAWFCRAEQFGEISIEMVPGMIEEPRGETGCFIREFRLENRGGRPAAIRMRMYADSGLPFSAERSLLLPPGAVRNVQLQWPQVISRRYLSRYSSNHLSAELELAINGRRVRHSLSPGGGGISVTTLVSGTVALGEFLSKLNSLQVRVSPVPVAQWGREPLDYSGLRSVWISSTDRLPTEVETALMRWVFGGGTLVVCVPPDAAWPEGEEPDEGVRKISHGWGTRILCRPIPPGGFPEAADGPEPEEQPGSAAATAAVDVSPFGMDNQSDESGIFSASPGLSLLHSLTTGGSSRISQDSSAVEDGLKLEIPTIPLHWLFFVMVAFVILIGPVNYFVLRKLHREMLLLATTPAISLLFCLLVIGFITVDEGWYSRAKASGITLLDQPTRLAATHVRFGVYAPIPPRGGLRFDSGDMLNFCGAGEIDLALNEGQHFRSGLIQPRIPLYAVVERVTLQREQLRIVREKNGRISVVNGLGVKLTGLGVIDDAGRLFVTDDPVEPGARVQLKPTSFRTGRSEMEWEALLKQFERSGAPGAEENFIRRNVREFARGYYVALTEEPLFYTPGFKPDQFEANHLVFGRYSFSGEE